MEKSIFQRVIENEKNAEKTAVEKMKKNMTFKEYEFEDNEKNKIDENLMTKLGLENREIKLPSFSNEGISLMTSSGLKSLSDIIEEKKEYTQNFLINKVIDIVLYNSELKENKKEKILRDVTIKTNYTNAIKKMGIKTEGTKLLGKKFTREEAFIVLFLMLLSVEKNTFMYKLSLESQEKNITTIDVQRFYAHCYNYVGNLGEKLGKTGDEFLKAIEECLQMPLFLSHKRMTKNINDIYEMIATMETQIENREEFLEILYEIENHIKPNLLDIKVELENRIKVRKN